MQSEIDDLLFGGTKHNKNSRRESTSSIESLTKSGRKKRSSSLIHSLAERLSEKENSPPPNSRRRLTSTRLSERDERSPSPPLSAKSTSRRHRAQSVSAASVKHHSKADSPPISASSRRSSFKSSKKEEIHSRHSSPPSPKISARSVIKHSPKEHHEEASPTHSLSNRRNSTFTKLLEQDNYVKTVHSQPTSPKISARKRTQSGSGDSFKTSSKDVRKSSLGLKSRSISLKGSKENLNHKRDNDNRNSDNDDVVVSPASTKSRSMSVGRKSVDENISRKSSKTLYKRPLSRPMSHFDLTDSMSLRSAAYQDWLKRKLEEKKHKRSVSAKQLKEHEEKVKVKETRKADALETYESWKRNADEKLKQKTKRDKHKKEKKALDEKEQKEEKARDAEKLFHVWKNEKSKTLREQHREKLKKKEEEKEKEEDKKQKRKEADMVFNQWKENKDKEIFHVVRAIKTIQQERTEVLDSMQNEKDLKATEAYEIWLRKKEVEKFDKLNDNFNQNDNLEPKIPWLPPNKTTATSKPTRMTKIRR